MSITGYEKKIKEWLTEHDQRASDRYVKKVARMVANRMVSMSDEDLERVFMHADVTPKRAFRNIAEHDKAAARRLGLVA